MTNGAREVRSMPNVSCIRHHLPPSVIQHTAWLHLRLCLSLRDIEDLLAECGFDLSSQTARRWIVEFGLLYASRLRQRRPRPDQLPGSGWHLDEIFVPILGRRMYLWRAVDAEGGALDVLVQSRHDGRAALKLFRKLLKLQGSILKASVTIWRTFSASNQSRPDLPANWRSSDDPDCFGAYRDQKTTPSYASKSRSTMPLRSPN